MDFRRVSLQNGIRQSQSSVQINTSQFQAGLQASRPSYRPGVSAQSGMPADAPTVCALKLKNPSLSVASFDFCYDAGRQLYTKEIIWSGVQQKGQGEGYEKAGYDFFIVDSLFLCNFMVTQECIDAFGHANCVLKLM